MKFHKATQPLSGTVTVPGDKSISHRAVMFGSLAEGTTEITNFLPGADCLSTIRCFRQMGISIEVSPDQTHVLVHGKGLHGLQAPDGILDCGNSGTTMRLLSGILAGQSFSSVLTGDASIQRRPMNRVIRPLTQMGGRIRGRMQDGLDTGCAPLHISGEGMLRGTTYHSPVASAQVKSCVLLAGLYADSPVTVTEPSLSRNHTELMLRSFGAELQTGSFSLLSGSAGTEGSAAAEDSAAALPAVRIAPGPKLAGISVQVPGDISSAAYFICAALLVPGSRVILKNVGINPTRDGILRVVKAMGGEIRILSSSESGGEPAADLEICSSPLHGTVIEGSLIPTLIDELPVIAVLAASAEGDTVIRDAGELRVKESDRLTIITDSLTAMGASVEPLDDGMIIHGGRPLQGARIDSHQDHRIAMSFAIAALAAEGETEISGAECVDISYPQFFRDLSSLQNQV